MIRFTVGVLLGFSLGLGTNVEAKPPVVNNDPGKCRSNGDGGYRACRINIDGPYDKLVLNVYTDSEYDFGLIWEPTDDYYKVVRSERFGRQSPDRG